MRLRPDPVDAGAAALDELADLDVGINEGLDPQPPAEASDDGPVGRDGSRSAVTHSESWWTHLRCTRCGHTFRRGDRVRLRGDATTGDPGSVVHLDPALGCADEAVATRQHPAPSGDTAADAVTNTAEDAAELAAFAAGLLDAWPPAGDAPVVRLAPHAFQVARPDMGPDAPKCLVCAHTFRPGEQVVVCPCGLHRGVCVAAVHRDPVAGLTCWDDWQPDGTLTHCPVTLNRVDR
ncbi:hypothetical protein [Frankia sp. CIT1]|uniref:hypothetical protein n=1 Tax=Frankia sp. CIT1 TaxID=2880974 RepID=UPI001EF633A1|nr:hypothetical protein [Frankia sp. CIT1]